MLPTFVIGLREGLEAALIVGIVAAFLAREGRRDLLKQVWLGVAIAVALCLGVGILLETVSKNLPYRQQEGLETVIGLIAVGMVTYMIVWMKRHSRSIKGDLEGAAAGALAKGSAFALVVMAFLAVLREGFETAVFLLATFQSSTNAALAATGAILGIAIAVLLGWGIYRGGVKLNLAKFFLVTSVLLVIVAGGLLMTAAHTAHEAGWIQFGQTQAMDLTAVIRPGTPLAALITGVLGIQPRPVSVEVAVWLLYVIPMLAYVLWPQRKSPRPTPVTEAAPTAPATL